MDISSLVWIILARLDGPNLKSKNMFVKRICWHTLINLKPPYQLVYTLSNLFAWENYEKALTGRTPAFFILKKNFFHSYLDRKFWVQVTRYRFTIYLFIKYLKKKKKYFIHSRQRPHQAPKLFKKKKTDLRGQNDEINKEIRRFESKLDLKKNVHSFVITPS